MSFSIIKELVALFYSPFFVVCSDKHKYIKYHKVFLLFLKNKIAKRKIDKKMKHDNCPQNLFCMNHSCLCCSECRETNDCHSECYIVSLDSIGMKEIQDFEERMEKLEGLSMNKLKQFEEDRKEIHDDVEKTFNDLRDLLDQRENELLNVIEPAYSDIINILYEAHENVDKVLESVETIKQGLCNTNSEEVRSQVFNVFSLSEKIADGMATMVDKSPEHNITELFPNINELKEMLNSLGNFNCSCTNSEREITVEKMSSGYIVLSWPPSGSSKYYQVKAENARDNSSKIVYEGSEAKCRVDELNLGETYSFYVRGGFEDLWGKWSTKCTKRINDPLESCTWMKCLAQASNELKYSTGLKVATKASDTYGSSTVVGSSILEEGKVSSWKIKVLKSQRDDGGGIFIGVAPFTIDRCGFDNFEKCGWYLSCYSLTLSSGPPHNSKGKFYKKGFSWKRCVTTKDFVGVTMDMKKGELSFSLNGSDLGIAYQKIPLDKPLVPCIIFTLGGDSVEISI